MAGYADAAMKIGVAQGKQGDWAAARLLEWLASTDRRWLIVLDDLTDPTDLDGWWPPASATGSTVVTTRRRDAALMQGCRFVDVGLFSAGEARDYLLANLADRPSLADDVDGVAADLGHLPLALGQAAAYLLDEVIPCSEYRRRFADRGVQLDRLIPDSLPYAQRQQQRVDVTWSLSIQAANRQRPKGLAEPLLQWASLLDPEGIPQDVMYAPATLEFLRSVRGGDEPVSAETVRQAARCLHRFSLANHDPDNPARCLRVHALVQRATRDGAPSELLDRAVVATADALRGVWPKTERDPGVGQALHANTNALATTRPDPLWAGGCHSVLFRAGTRLGEIGQVVAAADYYGRLHEAADERLGSDHRDTLATRNNLYDWQGQAGDLLRAAASFTELLADQLRVLGPDHTETLRSRAHVAYWHGLAGNPTGAAAAFAELFADLRRVLGPDHPHTLHTHGQLIRWQARAGDPSGAVTAGTELLIEYLRLLGPDHVETLKLRNNLAGWRGGAGDPDGAVAALADVLLDKMRVLGPDHPSTLVTRANLARWRGHAGNPGAAAAAYAELLTHRLRVLGPDHPHTVLTRHHLAYWNARAERS